MAQISAAQAANIAHNATQFGAIPQVASPVAPRQVPAFPGALLAGAPLNAPFAGAALAGAPYPAGIAAYAPGAALAPGFGGAPALAAAPYGALSPFAGAPTVYGGAVPAAYPAALGAVTAAGGLVAPTFAGTIPAGLNTALVAAAGPHLVDDWSAAHGYGFPATYGYGALPATTSTVALGGVANLYDGRLVGTAAANPALYAASYGAPYGAYGGYVAPSYVPTAVQGVPTYSALATHSAYTAADLYATVQFDGLNSFAPSYFSSSTLGTTALNTFVPNYFASYSGQFTATHGYY